MDRQIERWMSRCSFTSMHIQPPRSHSYTHHTTTAIPYVIPVVPLALYSVDTNQVSETEGAELCSGREPKAQNTAKGSDDFGVGRKQILHDLRYHSLRNHGSRICMHIHIHTSHAGFASSTVLRAIVGP